MAALKTTYTGALMIGGGMLAVLLSWILGAGPCNATLLGMILMILGALAVPAGVIVLVLGVFRADKEPV
jgi:hypothetical protein